LEQTRRRNCLVEQHTKTAQKNTAHRRCLI